MHGMTNLSWGLEYASASVLLHDDLETNFFSCTDMIACCMHALQRPAGACSLCSLLQDIKAMEGRRHICELWTFGNVVTSNKMTQTSPSHSIAAALAAGVRAVHRGRRAQRHGAARGVRSDVAGRAHRTGLHGQARMGADL